MGCGGVCDPYNGDTYCSESLPILCINYYKDMARPAYDYNAGGIVSDKGYYNGWGGGVFTVTTPVQGSSISSQAYGTQKCQQQFGPDSVMAEHHMGRYMNDMDGPPQKAWTLWNWSQTSTGGWGIWGYFGHSETGKVWTWINNQRNGNCN